MPLINGTEYDYSDIVLTVNGQEITSTPMEYKSEYTYNAHNGMVIPNILMWLKDDISHISWDDQGLVDLTIISPNGRNPNIEQFLKENYGNWSMERERQTHYDSVGLSRFSLYEDRTVTYKYER